MSSSTAMAMQMLAIRFGLLALQDATHAYVT